MTEPRSISVDVHAHCHVVAVEQLVAGQPGLAEEVAAAPRVLGALSVERNRELFVGSWRHALTDVGARLATMDRSRIDVQVVSISPLQYHSWADRGLAADIVAAANDEVAALVERDRNRFAGLAALSLQHPDLACAQLEHAVQNLGLRGAEIPTRAGNLDFSAPELEEFWALAESLGAALFIHPWGCTLDERLSRFYLGNTIGNPTETTVALSHLIFGGVFDRHPRLKVCAAHGGGYLPYYIGRSDHTWDVRPEARTTECPPSEYLRGIWFDSLVYRADTLRSLIDVVGEERVVLGTDYPYDMGVDDPVTRLDAVPGLSPAARAAILGQNAVELFGLDVRAGAAPT